MFQKKLKGESGFTLIELLVVIAIIGLLSSVVLASLNGARKKSRDARRVADLKQIQTALELYNNDNQKYPLAATVTNMTATLIPASYMASVPTDPDGSSYYYQYMTDSLGSAYCVGTLRYETTSPSNTCNTVAVTSLGTAASGRTVYGVGP